MTSMRRQLAWIFAAIIIVGIVTYAGAVGAAEDAATRQATQNYENSIASCQRGNPKGRAAEGFYTTTARLRHRSAMNDTNPTQRAIDHTFAVKAHTYAVNITLPPHVRPDGSTECYRAIIRP